MATFAVGDVQGCHAELDALLETTGFSPPRDRVIFVGDLVNRGPRSLEVLRRVHALGDAAECVLGNHDLHLLATAYGIRTARRQDTFEAILSAPDRDELLEWLRHRPLLVCRPELGVTLVHAGLPPQWDVASAQRHAGEVEAVLAGPDHRELLAHMYGNTPHRWSGELAGYERLRFIVNCLTRLRYCDLAGTLALGEKGPPGSQPPGYLPWFTVPGRASSAETIVFGHWSTLVLDAGTAARWNVVALDTGCVWGGALSAVRLDDGRRYAVPARAHT
ncbi:MAG: symmetrical bis(5'-nucleosyl)-tetraphosphatase [Gammaproteobacteria bacterium]|nr:symmetrical bis(5'-nucleosyl)-tetraphosphatase [Gammaproteobacteria bacterium]